MRQALAATGAPVAPRHLAQQRAAEQARLLERRGLWFLVAAAVAAVIGWGRYVVLVALRGQVVDVWVQWLSVAAVVVSFSVALALAVVLMVTLVRWLLAARNARWAPHPDPRRRWTVVLLSLVPGLNLVYLPVFLQELRPAVKVQPRVRRRMLWAWGLFAAAQVVAVAYWLQVWRSEAQAQANALSLGAAMLALSAAAAWWMRRVLRAINGAEPLRRLVYWGPVTTQQPATTPTSGVAAEG